MAFAVLGLGEAEAICTSVRVALLQIELSALTLVATLALYPALAETLRRRLKRITGHFRD